MCVYVYNLLFLAQINSGFCLQLKQTPPPPTKIKNKTKNKTRLKEKRGNTATPNRQTSLPIQLFINLSQRSHVLTGASKQSKLFTVV